jgi:hypothetical protein
MLLTPFNFPKVEHRLVISDVLTVEGHLLPGDRQRLLFKL